MTCHRCGYSPLQSVHWHDGHAYGPECIEIVKSGRSDAVAVQRERGLEVRFRRATCDRCDTFLGGNYTRAEHRAVLAQHRRSCR